MILTKSKIYENKLIPLLKFEYRNEFWNLTAREFIILYDQGEVGGIMGVCLVAQSLGCVKLLEYSMSWDNLQGYVSIMKYILDDALHYNNPVFIDHLLLYNSLWKFTEKIKKRSGIAEFINYSLLRQD